MCDIFEMLNIQEYKKQCSHKFANTCKTSLFVAICKYVQNYVICAIWVKMQTYVFVANTRDDRIEGIFRR